MKLSKKALTIGCSTLGIVAAVTCVTLPVVSCSMFGDSFKLSKKQYKIVKEIIEEEANNPKNTNAELLNSSIKTELNKKYNNSINNTELSINSQEQIQDITITFNPDKISIKNVQTVSFVNGSVEIVENEKKNDEHFTWNQQKNPNVVKCSFGDSTIETNFSNIADLPKITLNDTKISEATNELINTIDNKITLTEFNGSQNSQFKQTIVEKLGIPENEVEKVEGKEKNIVVYPQAGHAFEIGDSKTNDKFYINANGQLVINNVQFKDEAPKANDSLLFNPMKVKAKKARTVSVNVGMGDAEIIQVSSDDTYGGDDDFTILIDGGTGGSQGGREASSPNGVNAVSSALNWLKVTDVDLFVISHPHNDHMYGLPEIIMNYGNEDSSKALVGIDAWNKKASSSSTVVMKKVASALSMKKIETYDSVQIVTDVNKDKEKGKWIPSNLIKFVDDSNKEIGSFSVLGCTKNMDSTSMNRYSVSNIFEFNGHKELFAGDSEGITDKDLMEYYNINFLKSDIYKVSHHGSNTEGSNGTDWIKAIKPTYAIISAGAEDDYTLPDRKTLENLINEKYGNLKPENVLGTQPFGKSLILAGETNNGDKENCNNWKNINEFLKEHSTINNNNHGACVLSNGTYVPGGQFVDLNNENLKNNRNWTNVDDYYNMVMKGVGVVFDFSKDTLELNNVDPNSINENAWKPDADPTGPNGAKWIKLKSADYKSSTGVPVIVKLNVSNSLRNRENQYGK